MIDAGSLQNYRMRARVWQLNSSHLHLIRSSRTYFYRTNFDWIDSSIQSCNGPRPVDISSLTHKKAKLSCRRCSIRGIGRDLLTPIPQSALDYIHTVKRTCPDQFYQRMFLVERIIKGSSLLVSLVKMERYTKKQPNGW